jgi:hypothetical protein
LSARRDALQRWGRSTAHLGQQNGHIDVAFLRHLLGGRLEETEEDDRPDVTPATGLVTNLACDRSRLRVVWVTLGPPSLGLAFPCFLEASLPPAFTAESGSDAVGANLRRLCDHLDYQSDGWDAARDALARLQARFDQEAEEFAGERAALAQANQHEELRRQADLFLEHCLEQFREVSAGLLARPRAGRGLALSR